MLLKLLFNLAQKLGNPFFFSWARCVCETKFLEMYVFFVFFLWWYTYRSIEPDKYDNEDDDSINSDANNCSKCVHFWGCCYECSCCYLGDNYAKSDCKSDCDTYGYDCYNYYSGADECYCCDSCNNVKTVDSCTLTNTCN